MKEKKSCIKKIIIKFISCVMVSFLAVSAYLIPKKDDYIVYADSYTPVQKQSFVTWLLSYFGINIYTDAQQISNDIYTIVKTSYDLWLNTLQPNQRVPFDSLFNGIELVESDPNVFKTLRLSGWVYNAFSGFKNYLLGTNVDEVLGDYTGKLIGDFELASNSIFKLDIGTKYYIGNPAYVGNIIQVNSNSDVRAIYIPYTATSWYLYLVSDTSFSGVIGGSYNGPTSQFSSTSYNNYHTYRSVQIAGGSERLNTDYPIAPINPVTTVSTQKDYAIYYTFGEGVIAGDTEIKDVIAIPDQAVLNDLIGAVDPEDSVDIDLEDSDINISILGTLADLIDQVNALTDVYILDNSWPETIGKVIAQSVSISNELTDIDYPNAIDWEVPDPIATPQLIPLIEPDCPDLSACLVNGIQEVGSVLDNVIESNSNISNYVSVILFMGIALSILGGI